MVRVLPRPRDQHSEKILGVVDVLICQGSFIQKLRIPGAFYSLVDVAVDMASLQ